MIGKIVAKKYYKIIFELQSPLSVGSGINDDTDADITVDSKGVPYLPGSSLAGVYRRVLGSEEAQKSFGSLLEGTNDLDESMVITYDGILHNEDNNEYYIGKRDMVALDEYKTAITSQKFDFQILEPGIRMYTYIEINSVLGEDEKHKQAKKNIDTILYVWKNEGISFGTKTKRGYGLTKAIEIKEASFDFTNEESKEAWINFEIFNNDTNWDQYKLAKPENLIQSVEVRLELKQQGGLSIREYSTRVGEADYEQMKLHNKFGNNQIASAVIPGTTWAGAFRNQMKKLGMCEWLIDYVFGTVKKSDGGHQSHISFSESYVKDGVDIVYTRNAIDRFSGGAVENALYTESTRYNGSTELIIKIDSECDNEIAKYLAASIMDLKAGYMSVGGLTAVGRGLFDVTACTIAENKININYEEIKTKIEEALA